MKIRVVEFAASLYVPGEPIPEALPQVAFSGRSNVGKSSLVNVLLLRTRKKLARVSGEPGKTQSLNFYRVNDHFFLVDLPGFGYAKVSAKVRASWKTLIEQYLEGERMLRGVVHLVDARHDPTATDRQMVSYLAERKLPTLVVLTKMDKLKKAQRKTSIATAMEQLGLDDEQLLPFSSKTGEGRKELLSALESLVGIEELDK
jgi:GTP-binding protein